MERSDLQAGVLPLHRTTHPVLYATAQ